MVFYELLITYQHSYARILHGVFTFYVGIDSYTDDGLINLKKSSVIFSWLFWILLNFKCKVFFI